MSDEQIQDIENKPSGSTKPVDYITPTIVVVGTNQTVITYRGVYKVYPSKDVPAQITEKEFNKLISPPQYQFRRVTDEELNIYLWQLGYFEKKQVDFPTAYGVLQRFLPAANEIKNVINEYWREK